MERSEAYGFSAAMSGAFLLSCLLFAAINRRQRGPYMDEAFHVPQAQAYCHGRFLQWDPMITTLPGLYLVSVGVVKPAAWLFRWTGSVVCSVGMLRFINLLFSAGNFYLLYLLLLKIHLKNKAWHVLPEAPSEGEKEKLWQPESIFRRIRKQETAKRLFHTTAKHTLTSFKNANATCVVYANMVLPFN
ncbi:dol-P-Glc:Glc(2)Man(9)GlcNAc(2)-PP-Dol alpha-1,2-glucosyltransferase isoform X2 [Buteo buteo]|uniref:dol-P-Glc:Glc(2)Man(9)GlcNAc(2)-PP-Dol alpha-1,2-glucosyltransferase isoform X2 n=1 Tax=Buteo buteo TaxID=30397 RepID=UPI003EB91617